MITKIIIVLLIFLNEVIYFIIKIDSFEYQFERNDFIARFTIVLIFTVIAVYKWDDFVAKYSDTELEVSKP